MDTTQKNRAPARKHTTGGAKAPTPTRSPASQPRKRPDARSGTGKSPARKPEQRGKKPAPGKPAARRAPGEAPERRMAYGNSKPRKKTGIGQAAAMLQDLRSRAAADPKTKARKAARVKKQQQFKKQMEAPAVIYTQPKPFNRDRLILQVTTVAAVVLAMVLGLSVFFKVETITVSGAEVYSAWSIREASGIQEGDNLLTFSKIRAAGQIVTKLPYVEKVRIGIKLPDTVNIMVTEASVVYAIKASDGTWWLIDSNGRVIEQANSAAAAANTQILGVTLEAPVVNEQGIATESVQTETNEAGELLPATSTGALKLSAALKIVQALEDHDIVGEAASVDVSRLEDIQLWYGTRYQVYLGDTNQLTTKITWMNDAILQLSDYQTGVLDVSFTIWPDQVVYTPFD